VDDTSKVQIEKQFREIDRRLKTVERYPETTLNIIGEARSERHWESLLVYFIDKTNPHGFETDVLSAFLKALASHVDTGLSDLPIDLNAVEIQSQVATGTGPVDIVLSVRNEWFICIEMKVGSAETGTQTVRYANASQLGNVFVDKYDDTGEYVYLAPKHATSPTANEFIPVSWEHIVGHFEKLLVNNYGQYPSKSRAQFADFLDTIKRELHMTNMDEISTETKLYAEYHETIDKLVKRFEADQKQLLEMIETTFFAESECERDNWEFATTSTYVNFYKNEWHGVGSGVKIEYEPHVDLEREQPQILLRLDIEHGNNKQEIRERFNEKLGQAKRKELQNAGWEITDGSYDYLAKPIPLDFDEPEESVRHAIRELHKLRTIVEPHIEEIATENK